MPGLAIVTGGARGIGLGIVRALLDQRVVDEVAVLDRDPDDISEAKVYRCDVTDEASVREAVGAIGAVPRVVVNNAGGGEARTDVLPFDPFAPVDFFRAQVDLNLIAAHVVTRVVGPTLQRGAAICNTASIAGVMATPLFAYGAAKAGLIHWTKSMALALAPSGIRVNAVAPGFIYTRLWEQMAVGTREIFDTAVKGAVPLGTEQTPDDIANAVAFLCSERASQITGQVIAIDGGASTGRPLFQP
jgi:NAD(P)-dependent dehydrogenase (short-subunit alcohol dehydrogenase family)